LIPSNCELRFVVEKAGEALMPIIEKIPKTGRIILLNIFFTDIFLQ